MARPAKSQFVCQNCGAVSPRWAGKCAACGEWNTLTEEADVVAAPGSGLTRTSKGRVVALETLAKTADTLTRIPTGLAELDRVTGGGIVPGSALLIGGEPGIGKSTLLLQLAAAFAGAGRRAIYFSGEEAAAQIRLRAERLGLSQAPMALACETNISNILATLAEGKRPDLVVVDSIQTLWAEALEAAPGTVSQVRAATQSLVRYAKAQGAALVLVGHVTKDGQIAGPKVIEHMVDTVLYFEGDRGHAFRILRAAKNRFGATDEIGVFEMASEGLREVANPSELFLGDRLATTPGSAVFAGVEGTRPILVEIQALVVPSGLGTPRRAVVGWDSNRLSMLLAVIDARCGISFAQHDVYLNVAGGLKITEPAADLAAAAALLSSISNVALPPERVYFGEISLSGAVRPAGHMLARLKEAQKLGFKQVLLPAAGELDKGGLKLALTRVAHVMGLAEALGL
ncbi:MAG: DNA repair protein RadA [Alphaproteobacteria bacterium]|nr:MAG: DNA repair protein RadA [Alphaproteobacteria bacterium]